LKMATMTDEASGQSLAGDQRAEIAEPKIQIGDFVVRKDRWDILVHEVRKITAKQYVAAGRYSSRDHRYDRGGVVFSGPEEIARKLRDQLASSEALSNQERRASTERMVKRDDNYIRAAIAKAEGQD
jgi:hypothetical protein